jgi:hypothetical protein
MLLRKLALATAAVAVFATAAFAAVVINEDGSGFVGKGDIQNAFGWNNARFQENAEGVSFSYGATQSFDVTCQWFTGPDGKEKEHISIIRDQAAEVTSTVAIQEIRRQAQYTGFFIQLGEVSESTELPVVGGPCPGSPGNDKTIIDVAAGETEGGLYAHFGGETHLLQ